AVGGLGLGLVVGAVLLAGRGLLVVAGRVVLAVGIGRPVGVAVGVLAGAVLVVIAVHPALLAVAPLIAVAVVVPLALIPVRRVGLLLLLVDPGPVDRLVGPVALPVLAGRPADPRDPERRGDLVVLVQHPGLVPLGLDV